jgi:FKBP-type peptidyl-prolyl cis-trans isomerase FkpA
MNSTLVKLSLFSVVVASLVTACKNSGGGDFETDKDTGISIKFVKHDENGKKPSIGDIAHVKMIYKGVTVAGADTEIFNTIKTRRPGDTTGAISIPLQKTFSGCVEQAITLMAIGDSTVFKVSADSLFTKTFHAKELPKFLKPSSMCTFYIKLVSFDTKAEAQQKQQEMQQKRMADAMQQKALEAPAIAKYISDNHYEKIKPSADSLFVLDRKGGNGKAIKEGDSIKVLYTGTLLDGTVFDASSMHGNQPLSMTYSPTMQLIKGWVEVLGTMHEGEKAKILLPSALGYGPQQASAVIKPYSPLLFDLEVIKVTANKK